MPRTIARICAQRLMSDEKIGFNYLPMGYAEYEWGQTGEARKYLAYATDLAEFNTTIQHDRRSHTVTCLFSKKDGPHIRSMIETLQSGDFVNRGQFHCPRTVGWLVLGVVPMIVSIGGSERAEKFLQNARDQLEKLKKQ